MKHRTLVAALAAIFVALVAFTAAPRAQDIDLLDPNVSAGFPGMQIQGLRDTFATRMPAMVTAYLADVSTKASALAVTRVTGKLASVLWTISAPLSGTSAVINCEINGTDITGGGSFGIATAASGSGGSSGRFNFPAQPTVNMGDELSCGTDGVSTGTATATFTFVIEW